jgi:hypothetical protein
MNVREREPENPLYKSFDKIFKNEKKKKPSCPNRPESLLKSGQDALPP